MNATDTDVVAAIAQELVAQVGELRFNLWFKDNARLEIADHELVVGVPNLFFQEWLSSNFLGPLKKATESVTGRRLTVRVVVDAEMFRAMRSRDGKSKQAAEPAASEKPATTTHARRNAKRGIAALCLGGGNAVALAVERS